MNLDNGAVLELIGDRLNLVIEALDDVPGDAEFVMESKKNLRDAQEWVQVLTERASFDGIRNERE